MQFNKILKDLRTGFGYTQTQLASLAKLAPSCIAMLETNKREPTANTLIALSSALQVSTDYLLGLEDDFGAKTATPAAAPSPRSKLSAEELEIIEQYRNLPEQLRELVRQQLNIYSSPEELLPKNKKKV